MAKLPKEFFIGGNCTFTVKVPEAFASKAGTELHYTYKIEEGKIKLLTGPNNTKDYKFLGNLIPTTGQVMLTMLSCAGSAAWSVRILRRVMAQVFEGGGIAEVQKHGWDVDHMGKCGRCGRPLTVPESIEIGIGPECAAVMGITYPVRTKAAKPRKIKEVPTAVEVPKVELTGDFPQLPNDEVFF